MILVDNFLTRLSPPFWERSNISPSSKEDDDCACEGSSATGGCATGGCATGGCATGGCLVIHAGVLSTPRGFTDDGRTTGGCATGGCATGGCATGGCATGGCLVIHAGVLSTPRGFTDDGRATDGKFGISAFASPCADLSLDVRLNAFAAHSESIDTPSSNGEYPSCSNH